MRIVYLESAIEDLKWFRFYYENIFTSGKNKSQKQYYITKILLSENPYIGKLTHKKDVREFSIPKIPFSFIYRITENQIEVLHVWDERRNRVD